MDGLVPLRGGISSLTYAGELVLPSGADGERLAQRVVLKVAPPGLPAVRSRDVLRQAAVLEALRRFARVMVPRVLFTDQADPPMFAMTFVPGQSFEPMVDVSDAPPTPAVVRQRCLVAIRQLAELQEARPATLDVADKTVVSLSEEVERWATLFATAGPELASGAERLALALRRELPDELDPVLAHGDYRLGNMLFEGDRLTGVIDWEIWSFGDPRLDLGWFVMQTRALHAPVTRVWDDGHLRAAGGLPAHDELVEAYRERGRPSVGDLKWFLALAEFKSAAAIAVLAKQNRRRLHSDPQLEARVPALAAMIERGLDVLDSRRGRLP